MSETFDKAVVASKLLPSQSNDTLLSLYSLYKQATEGDVTIEKPTNFFDFPAIAKFNAWESLKGISKEVAEQKYIDLVKSLGK
jgi:diazepam-binding inhibitor (GABA receptor modulating acyl-CoA-binding protein)